MYDVLSTCLRFTCILSMVLDYFSPVISRLIPGSIQNVSYRLKFTKGTGRTRVISIDYSFTTHDIVCLVFCSLLGLWYLIKKVIFHNFRTGFLVFLSNRGDLLIFFCF